MRTLAADTAVFTRTTIIDWTDFGIDYDRGPLANTMGFDPHLEGRGN